MNTPSTFVAGMILTNEDRRQFMVSCVTTRIVVIQTLDHEWVESVSHEFARCKYRIVK